MEGKEDCVERDCIVFIPGLDSKMMDQSVEGLARRIAFSLDMKAGDAAATFHWEAKTVEAPENTAARPARSTGRTSRATGAFWTFLSSIIGTL